MAYLDAHRHDVVDGREVGVESICAVLRNAGVQIAQWLLRGQDQATFATLGA